MAMVANSLSTTINCILSQSICLQNGANCDSRSKSDSVMWLTSDLTVKQGFTCQLNRSQNFKYGRTWRPLKALLGSEEPNEGDDEQNDSPAKKQPDDANADLLRKHLENMVGNDDAMFGGRELATIIRNKYGRSYDVQLIKRDFMGRQLLAMNVMWKYQEQRSFPLTEEEYLLRLDDVANFLKCWGAVSYIRNSLAKTKERPRIGKVGLY
eukprot:c22765_g1_i4 orf=444-1073(-)